MQVYRVNRTVTVTIVGESSSIRARVGALAVRCPNVEHDYKGTLTCVLVGVPEDRFAPLMVHFPRSRLSLLAETPDNLTPIRRHVHE